MLARAPGKDTPEGDVTSPLGADRFEEVFAAGTRLTRREAVAAARGQRGRE
jgi:hypothetical protein